MSAKQGLTGLLAAFFAVFVYRDPHGASAAVGPFLGGLGHLTQNAIHSSAEFIAGFGSRHR